MPILRMAQADGGSIVAIVADADGSIAVLMVLISLNERYRRSARSWILGTP